MNGYNELREIHRLAQEAVLIYDSGEIPGRALIARIREIAGSFPKLNPRELGWQAIETVPQNGEFMALWPSLKLDDDGNITDKPAGHPPFCGVAYATNGTIEGPDALNATGDYFGDDWEYGQPTHWMPLPAYPSAMQAAQVEKPE